MSWSCPYTLRNDDNLVRKHRYHREREGNDGVTRRVSNAAGSKPGGIIGQIAPIGACQTRKDGEGENILHYESIEKIGCEMIIFGVEREDSENERRLVQDSVRLS